MAAEHFARLEAFAGIVRELDAAGIGSIDTGRMLDGGEGFVVDENRLAIAAAGGRAGNGEIVEVDVKQKNVLVGVVDDFNPFAAGGALEFHVQGHADGVGRGGELEFGLLGVKAAGAFDGEIVHPLERRGEMVGRGGEINFQFMAAGKFEAVPGEFVVKPIAAQDAVRPIKVPGQLFV